MTGRTNVGGGGIALNANIEQKEIKSGNITAGDFVQYYTKETIVEQPSRLTFCFNIGEYTIAKKGNGIALFKNTEQVDYFSRYNVSEICKYENFVLFYSHASNVIGCLLINTETNTFMLVSYETTSLLYSADDYFAIVGNNNKIIVLAVDSYSSGYMQFASADINNQGIISNIVISSQVRTKQGVPYLEAYNGNFYYIYFYSGNAAYYKLNIDSSGNVTIDNSSLKNLFSNHNNLRKMKQYENIVVYSAMGSASNYSPEIEVVDLLEGTSLTITLLGIPVTTIENHVFVSFENINYTEFDLHLYEYNDNSKEITLIDSYNFSVETASSISSFKNTDAYLNNGNVMLLLDYKNSIYYYKLLEVVYNSYIQETPEKNYVVPFSQYGHPIGVAKDSGIAGDEIDVYVPSV